MPSPETYAKQVETIQLDLDFNPTEEERLQLGEKKTSSMWRGLRLASKDQLSTFENVEHSNGLKGLFQPDSSKIEATSNDNAPTAPEDRDQVPQEEHPSVEEQRAGQQSQVTADTAAE